jgi:hypothetical protein
MKYRVMQYTTESVAGCPFSDWSLFQKGDNWLSLFDGWPDLAFILKSRHCLEYIEWGVKGGGMFRIEIDR